tara:strand:+ start:92086 stop:93627 length:1542 start_codon:yes stop_codon:yes gene_type:complete
MHGLDVTFQTLAETHNVSAVDVLIGAIKDGDKYIRRRALSALLQRPEKHGAAELLKVWSHLDEDNIAALKSSPKWLLDAVLDALKSDKDTIVAAIKAAQDVQLHDVVLPIIELAESHRSRSVRHEATEMVLAIAKNLGFEARHNRDPSTIRRPIVARLDTSVRCLSMHRNDDLVDAFLMVSAWSDTTLRTALDPEQPTAKPLLIRLEESQQYSVVELLTGFLHRRKISQQVVEIISRRPDDSCREALLRTTTNNPSAVVVRNLNAIGIPMSCRGGEQLMRSLPPERRAALAHVYIAAAQDITKQLHVVVTAIELGGPGCPEAGLAGLNRTETPSFEFWLPAIFVIAEDDDGKVQADEKSRLLSRLIDQLGHDDDAIVRGTRRILGALNVADVLPRFDEFEDHEASDIGKVVRRVDSDAIGQIRDGLRHPVLKKRIAAIGAADALAAVDDLVDLFDHISHEDHQEARILAAHAMAKARSEKTLDLLREMTELPDCAARDAAVEAYNYRLSLTAS